MEPTTSSKATAHIPPSTRVRESIREDGTIRFILTDTHGNFLWWTETEPYWFRTRAAAEAFVARGGTQ